MYPDTAARQRSLRMKALLMPVTLAQKLIEAQAISDMFNYSVGIGQP